MGLPYRLPAGGKYLKGEIDTKRKPLEDRVLNGDLMSRVRTY